MNRTFLLRVVTCLAFCSPAVGADLTKIDRAILKEPIYEGKPKYCLLAFGPEATTRVWLVQDGEVLYVDRNGNGDLTEPGESIKGSPPPEEPSPDGTNQASDPICTIWFEIGDLTEGDGKTKHTALHLSAHQGKTPIWEFWAKIEGRTLQRAKLFQFADRRGDAPVIHLRGPLRMALYGTGSLVGGQKEMEVFATVGTPGLGKGIMGQDVSACINWTDLPKGVNPIADIEFCNSKPDAKPIKATVVLSKRC